ncbi:MAG TPA: chemotaxis protein [Azospirillaceae bacterium]|nr:chemotaxis protein [Azospirillaceae bacterium]
MAPLDSMAAPVRADNTTRDGRKGGFVTTGYAAKSLNVILGHHRVSSDPNAMLVTTLGSCVAACIFDPVTRVGGMNHFLLPGVPGEHDDTALGPATRYGAVAMERLINDILKSGGRRECLEAKLFGGARVIESSLDVGATNAMFAIDYLRREGVTLVGQDLGGILPRRVNFFPATGRAFRRLLQRDSMTATANREMRFMNRLNRVKVEGKVELFDD